MRKRKKRRETEEEGVEENEEAANCEDLHEIQKVQVWAA